MSQRPPDDGVDDGLPGRLRGPVTASEPTGASDAPVEIAPLPARVAESLAATDEPAAPDTTALSQPRQQPQPPQPPARGPRWGRLRSGLASAVWLVAVLAALVLALSVLLVALKLDDTGAVKAVRDLADSIDLGVLRSISGSQVEGSNAAIRSALVNQGLAALIYLVAGKFLDKLIRP